MGIYEYPDFKVETIGSATRITVPSAIAEGDSLHVLYAESIRDKLDAAIKEARSRTA